MTDEKRRDEGAEDVIEDLEAPAAAQSDVEGGRWICVAATEQRVCDNRVYGGSDPQVPVDPTVCGPSEF